jgi:threonine dehydratase
MTSIRPDSITLRDITEARERIAGSAIRTPLIELPTDDFDGQLLLKLECLQPIGSFKIRGASNALGILHQEQIRHGVVTASAGNWAQGLAWNAQKKGVPCTIVVPEHAPKTKTDAIKRLGASVKKVPFDEWWNAIISHDVPGVPGLFVHPVSDPSVIAGNGTVGLEIIEEVPDVDAVVVPFGGGGLSCGISAALRGLRRDTPVYAAEVDTSAPLSASLQAGTPQEVDRRPSFVDGIGGRSVLTEMWPLARDLLAGSIVVTEDAIAQAIRDLVARARVVADVAGASSLAAARTGQAGAGKIVCVISGGNIDADVLATILGGVTPAAP